MNKTAKLWLVFVLLLVFLAPSAARADVVADWNAIATQTALQTVIPPVRPGPSAILDLAMLHAAMHDAIQAFEGRFESYGAPIPNGSGSPVAAAARAAHDVLVARFPNQSKTLDTLLDNYLIGLGLLGNEGEVVGHQAAANILSLRAGDGSFGEWRPTLPAFASMASPWLGAVLPFTLVGRDGSCDQVACARPPSQNPPSGFPATGSPGCSRWMAVRPWHECRVDTA